MVESFWVKNTSSDFFSGPNKQPKNINKLLTTKRLLPC